MNEMVRSVDLMAGEAQGRVAEVHDALEAVERYFRERLMGGGEVSQPGPGSANGFGLRVRKLRESLGLSQSQFAERYGLDLATLRGWEQGRRKPDKANRTFVSAIETNPVLMATIIERSRMGGIALER